MGLITMVVNFLFGLFVPRFIVTIFALLIAVMTYGIFLIKFGALTSDEIVALPKGAMIYRFLQKVHLLKEEY